MVEFFEARKPRETVVITEFLIEDQLDRFPVRRAQPSGAWGPRERRR